MLGVKNKALFLDRDGTLNVDIHHLHEPDRLELIPGTREALEKARAAGYLLFLHTNQSGVGRGIFTLDNVHACNTRMLELIGLGSDLFLKVCIAPEHPERDEPVYRKPSPRFIREMAAAHGLDVAQCWMLGDRQSDWQAGLSAGARAAALRSGAPWTDEAEQWRARHRVPDFATLLEFVEAELL